MRWLLIGLWTLTAGLIVALVVLLIGLGGTGARPPAIARGLGAAGPDRSTAGAPAQPAPRDPYQSWGGWVLISRLAAHNVLILTVQTETLHEALSIAHQLVERQARTYAEVMIYFKRPGELEAPPARRIQWTPSHGYVETNLEDYYPTGSANPAPDQASGQLWA